MQAHPLVRKIVAYILLFSCVNFFLGCQRFYRPVKVDAPSVHNKHSSLKQLADQNRYFILRKGNESYSLNNIALDQKQMTLSSNVDDVSADHQLYIRERTKSYNYSKSKYEDVVLNEVHLFISDTVKIDTSHTYTLPLSIIEKIEVIEYDRDKSSRSRILGTIGLVLGAGLVVLIIAAATAPEPEPEPTSSCPYISVYDGKDYKLQGEVFGGAIFPQLQRDDYLPLQMQAVNGVYNIKISNELQEVQHTDFADLLVVEHDPAEKIMIDPDGQIQSISNPRAPDQAMLNESQDVRASVLYQDNQSCLFNDLHSMDNSESLYLTFKNDKKFEKAKLVLNLKSSSWFDNLYGEFMSGFGNYYGTWTKKQLKVPSDNLEKWIQEQDIPLTISVKTSQGWREVKKLNTIGPLLNREVVVSLDVPANEVTDIKLSCGFMFWELDYAAIDYSDNKSFTISRLKPHEAINEKGSDVLPAILNADKQFLHQPKAGDATILKYKSRETATGKIQTVFLHTSGYYEHIRDFKGFPKTAFLKSFKKPGAFPAFSKQQFTRSWNTLVSSQNK